MKKKYKVKYFNKMTETIERDVIEENNFLNAMKKHLLNKVKEIVEEGHEKTFEEEIGKINTIKDLYKKMNEEYMIWIDREEMMVK